LYIAIICITVTLVIFMYVGLYNTKYVYRDQAIMIAFGSGLIAVGVSIIMTFLSCKSIPTFKSYTINLQERLLKVIEYWNKKLYKQGLVLVPGTKFVWIEIWKIKETGKGQIPYISLIGRDPIVDYNEDELENILQEKSKELEETFSRRYGTKYQIFDYLKEHLQKDTVRREKALKEKAIQQEQTRQEQEYQRQILEKERLAEEEAAQMERNEGLENVAELPEDLEQSPNASQRKLASPSAPTGNSIKASNFQVAPPHGIGPAQEPNLSSFGQNQVNRQPNPQIVPSQIQNNQQIPSTNLEQNRARREPQLGQVITSEQMDEGRGKAASRPQLGGGKTQNQGNSDAEESEDSEKGVAARPTMAVGGSGGQPRKR
jgi:hypothetical protein